MLLHIDEIEDLIEDLSFRLVLFVASASEADAVTPTAVPFAALSETRFEVPSLSDTAPTSNSSASERLMTKLCWLEEQNEGQEEGW